MPKQAAVLLPATSRNFNGGLDVADSDLNLSSKFARVLDNLVVGIDGSLQIRQGTQLFSDLAEISNYSLVNCFYFAGRIVSLNTAGEVFLTDSSGVSTRIWDSTIAAAKRVGLKTWGPTNFVAFLEFNGELLMANGVDKPLVMGFNLIVDYLADKATGSNINVPIGAIMEKFSTHVCIATGSTLYVSEKNASGTWSGDSGTQYANTFNMATYVASGDTTIVGLLGFKGYLLVMFKECIVPIQFNEIAPDGTNPASLGLIAPPDSLINAYGTFSPRTCADIGSQTMACDIVGVESVSLTQFTKILDPNRPSRLIDPLLQKHINSLDTDTLFLNSFSVFDRRLSNYMLFMPDNEIKYQRHCTGYVYKFIDEMKIQAWHRFVGWNWCGAARSSEGNIFFIRANDTKIFVMGHEINNPINVDFKGEQETFTDGTTFTDQTGFGPVADVEKSGVPIKWAWELPSTDLKNRASVKTLRYIVYDTEGSAQFTTKVFIDNKYALKNGGEPFTDGTLFDDDTGFDPWADPPLTQATTLDFVGKDRDAYGMSPYGDLYGDGNNADSRKLTLDPTKGMTFKLRLEGESIEPLKFVGITMLYQLGSIRRLNV